MYNATTTVMGRGNYDFGSVFQQFSRMKAFNINLFNILFFTYKITKLGVEKMSALALSKSCN